LFGYEKDIYILELDLFLDATRKKDFGFISHAHADYIANHRRIICSPPTADLLRLRLKKPQITPLKFGAVYSFDDFDISLCPAGHILGSSQILIKKDNKTLLYSGDFRTKPAKTVEAFQQVKSDILILESTFGRDTFKMPERGKVVKNLIEICKEKLEKGTTPIVFAYTLGKGQEALKILCESGLPIAVDYSIGRFVPTYIKHGIQFKPFHKFRKSDFRGKVLLLSPGMRYQRFYKEMENKFSIFLSGWGMEEKAVNRFGVDVVMPFSDHADFDELLGYIKNVGAEKIYCTHGDRGFVKTLQALNYNAEYLE
jgi:Cft2 family RNA processing exonuclease